MSPAHFFPPCAEQLAVLHSTGRPASVNDDCIDFEAAASTCLVCTLNDTAFSANTVVFRKISPLLGQRAMHVLLVIDYCILQIRIHLIETSRTTENTIASIHR